MRSKLLKGLSLACQAAASLSLMGSVALYATGRLRGDKDMENDGLFVGLWVPTFYILSDRFELAALEADAVAEPLMVVEELDILEPQSPHPLSHVPSGSF